MSDRSVTFSCADTAPPPTASNSTAASTARTRKRIGLTILHAAIALAAAAGPGLAQDASAGPFTKGRWSFETEAIAALEAWNYNVSHEELFGLTEGVTYAVGDGVMVRAMQRFVYVSQRSQDAVILGVTFGARTRLFQHGRVTGFVQGDLGISHTAVAAPPRGTRFNYLAIGGGGAMVRLSQGVHAFTTLHVVHISNAGLKGPGRNPDIEAIGPSLGLSFRF